MNIQKLLVSSALCGFSAVSFFTAHNQACAAPSAPHPVIPTVPHHQVPAPGTAGQPLISPSTVIQQMQKIPILNNFVDAKNPFLQNFMKMTPKQQQNLLQNFSKLSPEQKANVIQNVISQPKANGATPKAPTEITTPNSNMPVNTPSGVKLPTAATPPSLPSQNSPVEPPASGNDVLSPIKQIPGVGMVEGFLKKIAPTNLTKILNPSTPSSPQP